MKVLFMGSPAFAVRVLEGLSQSEHEIVGVVSGIDKPRGRKKVLTPTEVKAWAIEHNIPVFTPEKINSTESIKTMQSFGADVAVVASFGKILKTEVLNAFPYGCLNVHGSLLPKYRGASPMQSVLKNGEKETGITIMYMAEDLDAGDMFISEKITIGDNETYSEIHDRLGDLGGVLIGKALSMIEKGEGERIPQNHEQATYCTRLTRADELIDWSLTGQDIHNQIRSLSTEPGAYTSLNGEVFKIINTTFEAKKESNLDYGTVLSTDKKKGVEVSVKGGSLWLLKVKPAGKKVMNALDWYRGCKTEVIFKSE